MKDLFCNSCSLTGAVPELIAREVLGMEQLYRILFRYQQMRGNYALTYAEWQQVFTEDLKPFRGYSDTTSVTMPVTHPLFGADIAALGKGAIGVDLPTWFNMQESNRHVMMVAQDPLRSSRWYGECFDAVVSSPFGQQDFEHRQRANGGKMMSLLLEQLTGKGYGVYLTDANKYFVYDHETTDEFSASHADVYAVVLTKEVELVRPAVVVCLGRSAERMCKRIGLSHVLSLPHLTGTARGAMVKRFPRLNELGATVEHIAEVYAQEIMNCIMNQ